MATHSSVLAWRILGTGEPGGLPSMGSHRVGHDWSDLAAATLLEGWIWRPDHLTCLLRNLYAGWEATVRTGHETTDWFQIGKRVRQGCILSPCLFTLNWSTSCEILAWMKHKLESRLLGEISITSDTQMIPPLWQKVKRNTEPLDESEKSKWSRSAVSNSLQPRGLQPTRLLRPWDFPGKSTGVGCHCLIRQKPLQYCN